MTFRSIVLFLLLALPEFDFAQNLTWEKVNTPLQDLPLSVGRMTDGNLLVGGIRFGYYYSKRNLILIKLDESGKPISQKEIGFSDTSISNIGGVFPYGESDYLVFASFDIDTPYSASREWGYILLDSSLNTKRLYLDKALLDRQGIVSGITNLRIKKGIGAYYYGVMQLFDYDENNPDTIHYLILDKTLNVIYRNIDTLRRYISLDGKDTTLLIANKEQFGDMVQMNDSLFLYMSAPMGVTGSYSFAYNIKSGRVYGEQWVVVPLTFDTSMGIDRGIIHTGSNLQLSRWTDSTIFVSAPVKYYVNPKVGLDTNLNNNSIAQSAIVEVLPNVTSNKNLLALKYILVENYPWLDSIDPFYYNASTYHSAEVNNLDYTDPDRIYYARVASDAGFFHYGAHSVIFISQFNHELKKKWTISFQSTSPPESPYNILATKDGGCLLFNRKRHRFINDPDFTPPGQFPEYDIAVYKISNTGKIDAVNENKIYIYPNPTSGIITIHGNYDNARYELYEMSGRVIKKGILNENSLDASLLLPGMYFLKIALRDNWVTLKLIKE